jgi:predicted phage terminase large subunit-like protein
LFRRRLEYPALKRAAREQQGLFGANVVLIEDKASGTQLIEELIAEGCHAVTRYQPTADKVMRLHAQTATIENGFVAIPETAPWLAEYLHEMTVFPKGKHDDQVDPTAQFLDWLKRPFPGQDFYELTRIQAEAIAQPTRPQPVEPIGSSARWNGKPSRKKPTEWHFLMRIAPRDLTEHDRTEPPRPGPRVRIRFLPAPNFHMGCPRLSPRCGVAKPTKECKGDNCLAVEAP